MKPRWMVALSFCVLFACLLGILNLSNEAPVLLDFSDPPVPPRTYWATPFVDLGEPAYEPYLGHGWSRPERDAGGTTFQWVRSERAELSLLLHGDHARSESLRFRAMPIVSQALQTFALRVNGRELGKPRPMAPGFHDYHIDVAPGLLQPGWNRFTFEFGSTEVPAHRGLLDQRSLAVAFDFFGIGEVPAPPAGWLQRPGWRKSGDTLLQSAGSELVFSLVGPERAYLEIAVADHATAMARLLSPQIRIRAAGQEEKVVFSRSLYPGEGMRRIDLSEYEGEPIEVIFSNPGLGEPLDESTATTAWQLPALHGRLPGLDVESNVIFIVVDTLRADHVSCYGDRASTPHMDTLAAQGIRFTRAYSHVPITGPAISTMFTSLLPAEHGVLNNGQVLPERHRTLAEIMRDHFRTTAAFVSLGVVSSKFGLGQGFARYEDDFSMGWWKDASEVNDGAIAWLEREASKPFFLWLHYSDPHEPYRPPSGAYEPLGMWMNGEELTRFVLDGREVTTTLMLRPGPNRLELRFLERAQQAKPRLVLRDVGLSEPGVEINLTEIWEPQLEREKVDSHVASLPASFELLNRGGEPREITLRFLPNLELSEIQQREAYRREVEFLDGELGRLFRALKGLGVWEKSLIILTADHGEGLGDHGYGAHVDQLYEEQLHVPLIVRLPGAQYAGTVSETLVGHVDLLSGICGFVGCRLPKDLAGRGKSLFTSPDEAGETRSPIFAATYQPQAASNRTALIGDGYKYIVQALDGKEELYQIRIDPNEQNNLADEKPFVLARARREMEMRIRELSRRGRARGETVRHEEVLKMLRSLGYIH